MLASEAMKRAIPIVAWTIALLLMVQPAFAESSCSPQLRSGDKAANTCCIHPANAAIHEANADSSTAMLSTMTPSGCSHSDCCVVSPRQFLQITPPPKSKASGVASLIPILWISDVTASGPPLQRFRKPITSGPGRYILFEVFRI